MFGSDSVLTAPDPQGHFVQLYDGDATTLSHNVAKYLSEGFQRHESSIVIATPEHVQLFLDDLRLCGIDPKATMRTSQLLVLDAERTLGEFMLDGSPMWDRFERTIRAAIARVTAPSVTGLRAYGEMVGVLWTQGQYTAAIQLEEFWNKLLAAENFSLFCSYPIDIFGSSFQIASVDAVLCDHTHLIPGSQDECLGNALAQAMDERLGERADAVRHRIRINHRPAWAALPPAEGAILWLKQNLPEDAEAILTLTRQHLRNLSSSTA